MYSSAWFISSRSSFSFSISIAFRLLSSSFFRLNSGTGYPQQQNAVFHPCHRLLCLLQFLLPQSLRSASLFARFVFLYLSLLQSCLRIGSVRSCPRSPLLLRFIICCLIRSVIFWYSCLYCTRSAQMPMQFISAQALHGSTISFFHLFASSGFFCKTSLWSSNSICLYLLSFSV